MSPLLSAENLVKHYGAVKAVNGVTFHLEKGICLGLLGPNGAGKTTTVEMLEGIVTPTTGNILYKGSPLNSRFRDEAGIMFQSTSLQEFISVRETLDLFRGLYAGGADIEELVSLCALEEFLDQDSRRLSGGQRQRLLLAIALINAPEIVFLDEPTTGLDPQARRNFWSLVERIKAQGTAILLTTHYMEEAYRLCDDIAIMDHGKVIARGTPQNLLASHFDDVVLELPRTTPSVALEALTATILENAENYEIVTGDVDNIIRQLIANDVNLDALSIRPRTLEDLFLELTGRALRG